MPTGKSVNFWTCVFQIWYLQILNLDPTRKLKRAGFLPKNPRFSRNFDRKFKTFQEVKRWEAMAKRNLICRERGTGRQGFTCPKWKHISRSSKCAIVPLPERRSIKFWTFFPTSFSEITKYSGLFGFFFQNTFSKIRQNNCQFEFFIDWMRKSQPKK